MKKIRIFLFLLFIMVSAVIFQDHAPSVQHAMIAGAVIALCLLPSLLFFLSADHSAIPFFQASCFYYVAFFGVPVFLSYVFWRHSNDVVLYSFHFEDHGAAFSLAALTLVFVSLSAYIGAFYGIRALVSRASPTLKTLPFTATNNDLVILAWGATLIHSGYYFFPEIQALPSIGQLAPPMGIFGFGIFIYLSCARTISVYHRILTLGVIYPIIILKILSHGFLTPVLTYVAVAFLALFYVRRRVPWKLMVAGAALLFVGYDSVYLYRALSWDMVSKPIYRNWSVTEKVGLFGAVLLHRTTGISVVDIPKTVSEDALSPQKIMLRWRNRVSHITVLSGTMEQTPSDIPHWEGESYRPLMGTLIPRIFWPDKPREEFGGTFGARYWGTEKSTSVNLPWLVELYGNFGRWGMVLGMAFFGSLFALLDRVLNNRGAPPAQTMIGLAVLTPWVFPESNFSVMVGGTPLLIIAMFAYVSIGVWALRVLRLKFG